MMTTFISISSPCAAFSCSCAALFSPTPPSNQPRLSIPSTSISRIGTHIGVKHAQRPGTSLCCFKESKRKLQEDKEHEHEHDSTIEASSEHGGDDKEISYSIGQPSIPPFMRFSSLSAADQASILLTFIACTTTVAFVSLVVAVIPTLNAMRKTASSLEKLADTAREELPGTMAAIRLSGMEISDFTVELSDLSQEVSDGVRKSAQAVRAAEVGIRHLGGLASSKALSLLEARANLPVVVTMRPVVASAAETTSTVVQRARKALMHIISRSRFSSNSDLERSETS